MADDIITWAKSFPSFRVSDKIKIVATEHAGNAVISTQSIEPGDQLISCPRECLIGPGLAATLFQVPIEEVTQPMIKYAFVHEVFIGPESKWYPYIQALKGSDKYSVFHDSQGLEYTNVYNEVVRRQLLWKGEFEELLRRGVNFKPTLRYGQEDTDEAFGLYRWVSIMFLARAFPVDAVYPQVADKGLSMLVPIVDMLNHRPYTKITWLGNNEPPSFDVVTGESYQPGQEVFNNYGTKSNEELLLSYGFALENNPSEYVAVELRLDGELHRIYLTKKNPVPDELLELFAKAYEQSYDDFEGTLPLTNRKRIAKANEGVINAVEAKLMTLRDVPELAENAQNRPEGFHNSVRIYLNGQREILQAALAKCRGHFQQGLEQGIYLNMETLPLHPYLSKAIPYIEQELNCKLEDMAKSDTEGDALQALVEFCLKDANSPLQSICQIYEEDASMAMEDNTVFYGTIMNTSPEKFALIIPE